MFKNVLKILLFVVMLIVSILPNLYMHTCSGNICSDRNKEISLHIFISYSCCHDNSFSENETSHNNLNKKCCKTSLVINDANFLRKEKNIIFSGPEFFVFYFNVAYLLYTLSETHSESISSYGFRQHLHACQSGRILLSLICILTI